MSDHLADAKTYARAPLDEAAVAGLTETDRLVLSKPDTKYVACSGEPERDRVRENVLKRKLGLSGDDLDASAEAVCTATAEAGRSRSRLTFHHLSAGHHGKPAAFA